MHEILYELRDHSAGLNCGRWDYIFSFIKKFRSRRDFVTPDRAQITMDKAFLAAYVDLLIRTCHRRGIHAMGGMAAQIPIKSDPDANAAAMAKVEADKLREVRAGHDGTWVAHPGLVPVAKAIFDEHMPGANQIDRFAGRIAGATQKQQDRLGERRRDDVPPRSVEAARRAIPLLLPGHRLLSRRAQGGVERPHRRCSARHARARTHGIVGRNAVRPRSSLARSPDLGAQLLRGNVGEARPRRPHRRRRATHCVANASFQKRRAAGSRPNSSS
jgi:hypothetical protein